MAKARRGARAGHAGAEVGDPRGAGDRAFAWRGGARIAGTSIVCDGRGAAGDLLFLSCALVRPTGRGAVRPGQELLLTEATLAGYGRRAEAWRGRALLAVFGRPFVLGALRLELVPTGFVPGAAALLVDGGGRRILYAGTLGRAAGSADGSGPEVRAADAVCVDASRLGVGDARVADLDQVRAYLRAAGAREVAVLGGRAEVVAVLRADGYDAYSLGPPRQMELPAGR